MIRIFTEGLKPAGYMFESDLLKHASMPDCVFTAIHTWDIDDAAKRGLVWKLRSLAPQTH